MEFSVEQYTNELVGFSKGGMPSRNKKITDLLSLAQA